MTTIYFVRHCKPDTKIYDDRNRPLTEEDGESIGSVQKRNISETKSSLFSEMKFNFRA